MPHPTHRPSSWLSFRSFSVVLTIYPVGPSGHRHSTPPEPLTKSRVTKSGCDIQCSGFLSSSPSTLLVLTCVLVTDTEFGCFVQRLPLAHRLGGQRFQGHEASVFLASAESHAA